MPKAARPNAANRSPEGRATLSSRRSSAADPADPPIPSEPALLWGLLSDLLRAPFWLLLVLFGRTQLSDGLRPLLRLWAFATAARMTAILIVVNLAVFTAEGVVRARGLDDAQLLHTFALHPEDLVAGHYLPLVLHVFAHGSLAHLVGNMLALFVFGRVVERHLGPSRVLLAYGLAAFVSTNVSLTAQLLFPSVSGGPLPTLGASGAVAGLVALAVLLQPLSITFEALVPLPLFVVGWLAMAADVVSLWRAASGHAPRLLSGSGAASAAIDHPAHLGGYLSACLFYFLLKPRQKERARTGLYINIVSAALAFTVWNVWLRR